MPINPFHLDIIPNLLKKLHFSRQWHISNFTLVNPISKLFTGNINQKATPRLHNSSALGIVATLHKEKSKEIVLKIADMDGHDSEDSKQSTADMSAFVQNLLQQMQTRFQSMSDNIVTKIDEMGTRINELERSIGDLRTEMGIEGSPSPAPQSKPEEDGVKQDEGSA